jgi:hypothetical protein
VHQHQVGEPAVLDFSAIRIPFVGVNEGRESGQRSDLKLARTSSEKACGCSQAAK